MILETQRLILRQFTLKDVDTMLPVLGDPEAMVYYPHPFSRDEVEAFIRKQQARYAETGHGLWAMVLKNSAELIGDCGLALQEVEGNKHIEVGYHLRRDHWHNGYATEAARVSIRYGHKLHAKELICMIRPENKPLTASSRAQRNEAQQVGFLAWLNHLIYSISREEWFESFRRDTRNGERMAEKSRNDIFVEQHQDQ